MSNDNVAEMNLPKNIRQIGAFGEKYRVYIEDFVYTYVHRFIHQRRREEAVLAAVLLGRSVVRDEQEYVFISGAQKVDFGVGGAGGERADVRTVAAESGQTEKTADSVGDGQVESMPEAAARTEGMPNTAAAKQAEFWDRVYQRIKQSFDDLEILGWYFNLDGSSLEINPQLQQFFESTYKKGSRFLYFEDCLEQIDAFYVQEQHRLQRLTGYAVYYEKNPQMQQFMIEEKERQTPKPIREREAVRQEKTEDVVQNYRAIMNKLNEKPTKRRWQPAIYVAGAAVLVIVAATAVTQIGNYQSLKTLQQTMQALSGAVSGNDVSGEEELSSEEDAAERTTESEADQEKEGDSSGSGDTGGTDDSSSDDSGAEVSSLTDDTETAAESSSDTDSGEEVSASTAETAETGTTVSDYYIVQKGDNLMAISQSVYNTTSKVDEICELNGIEDMDMIYEGQKLLLP